MKFDKYGAFAVGNEYYKLNELSAEEQEKLVEKYPQLRKLVIYEADIKGSADGVDIQPEPKQRKPRKRKSST